MESDQPASSPFTTLGRSMRPTALARGLWARPKLYIAIAAAVATLFLAPSELPASARAVMGWDVGAVVYVLLALRIFQTFESRQIKSQAEKEDETRFVFFAIILLAALSSFASVVGLIGEAKNAAGYLKSFYIALAGVSIFGSWMVVQIVFTLHYAHDFYRAGGGENEGCLNFPGDGAPDYWDFLYFTTSIGAASQTSDVSIVSKDVRRLVTFHAIFSFVFNTVVVALAINLAAGLL